MRRARIPAARGAVGQGGITLVVVLVLLVVISLTAAAAMRSAITQEKVVNNVRTEFAAQSQAELALRFCESELQKEAAQRVPPLRGVNQLPLQALADLQWPQPSAWAPATGAGSTVSAGSAGSAGGTTPPAAFLQLDPALAPGPWQPQCLVERLRVSGGNAEALAVTARGFSPDYRPSSSTDTGSGSVVWLQSFLYFE